MTYNVKEWLEERARLEARVAELEQTINTEDLHNEIVELVKKITRLNAEVVKYVEELSLEGKIEARPQNQQLYYKATV